SMRLDYMGNDDIYGIPTKKFYMDSMFISPHYIRANKCFCPDNEYCRYNGTLPLGKCMFGLPITYSKPHFYGADPIFHEMIKGLKPDADKHQSYFHINTMLAVPLQVRVCIQINLNVKTSRNLRLVANLRDMMLPVAWINLTAGIMGSGHEWKVFVGLVGPVYLARVVGIVVTCVGIIRLGKALFLPLRKTMSLVYLFNSKKAALLDDTPIDTQKKQFMIQISQNKCT
ncbi:scavenger receptor class B member 1-like, partial [Centruroides sculpturatus]|uniref:scavenger receptor class B member 1-like n=1 Tax=Centruroides sculpturatus TaxID=218467 RepID=UPI000C6E2546